MMKAANIAVAALILAAIAGPSLPQDFGSIITQIEVRADATWDTAERMARDILGLGA